MGCAPSLLCPWLFPWTLESTQCTHIYLHTHFDACARSCAPLSSHPSGPGLGVQDPGQGSRGGQAAMEKGEGRAARILEKRGDGRIWEGGHSAHPPSVIAFFPFFLFHFYVSFLFSLFILFSRLSLIALQQIARHAREDAARKTLVSHSLVALPPGWRGRDRGFLVL